MLVFVEGDAGGCERNGAKLISELLWEDCRAALRLQANPGTGGRIRQQAGSHRNLSYEAAVGAARQASHRLISYKVTILAWGLAKPT
ncbi:hypothetical protein MA04_02771 [Alcanivorax balearicus MACL04]|uniref:Uncharacterized protein n=1 Tax=Alloalcanivorax balearicus MACL04 TaxID=1177182 RepID=A0ABT2R135_9GAMM|nr:hypothetical protein [Alloalcanivorax balearicus MACL04]